jgi:hypothetical protein
LKALSERVAKLEASRRPPRYIPWTPWVEPQDGDVVIETGFYCEPGETLPEGASELYFEFLKREQSHA